MNEFTRKAMELADEMAVRWHDNRVRHTPETFHDLNVFRYALLAHLEGGELKPILDMMPKAESREAWSFSYPAGMSAQDAANELSDYAFLLDQIPKVYCHITGGRLSKTNYHAHAVIGVHDEVRQEEIDEAVKEALEERDAEAAEVAAILQSHLGASRDNHGLSAEFKALWDKCQRVIDSATPTEESP